MKTDLSSNFVNMKNTSIKWQTPSRDVITTSKSVALFLMSLHHASDSLKTLWVTCTVFTLQVTNWFFYLQLPIKLNRLQHKSTNCFSFTDYNFKRLWFITFECLSFSVQCHMYRATKMLTCKFMVTYLKHLEERKCCRLIKADFWFSCGCLCWCFSVVLTYFCIASWFL